jgi:HTH-type transcriptional regulator/antitoxin HigA
MRIIARKALRDFWETHPGAEQPLKAWFREAAIADWPGPAAVKAAYRSASVVGGNRVVFNVEIKPIKTERDYRGVMARIDLLMDARPNTAEGDRLDVLATLAQAWEEKHHAIDAPDPVQAIEFAMEQRGLTRRDLEPYIGSRARVAEVLNHKRSLTLAMIRRLHTGLGIPAEVLIGASD